jgi:GntR family transcriptional regulator
MTVESVLDGSIKEGDLLPSVRSVAEQFQVSPLTVLKGHQELVNEGVVEVHRGRGMFIRAGARRSLLQHERERLLKQEWPRIESKIHRLGIQLNELLGPGASAAYPKSAGPMTRKH